MRKGSDNIPSSTVSTKPNSVEIMVTGSTRRLGNASRSNQTAPRNTDKKGPRDILTSTDIAGDPKDRTGVRPKKDIVKAIRIDSDSDVSEPKAITKTKGKRRGELYVHDLTDQDGSGSVQSQINRSTKGVQKDHSTIHTTFDVDDSLPDASILLRGDGRSHVLGTEGKGAIPPHSISAGKGDSQDYLETRRSSSSSSTSPEAKRSKRLYEDGDEEYQPLRRKVKGTSRPLLSGQPNAKLETISSKASSNSLKEDVKAPTASTKGHIKRETRAYTRSRSSSKTPALETQENYQIAKPRAKYDNSDDKLNSENDVFLETAELSELRRSKFQKTKGYGKKGRLPIRRPDHRTSKEKVQEDTIGKVEKDNCDRESSLPTMSQIVADSRKYGAMVKDWETHHRPALERHDREMNQIKLDQAVENMEDAYEDYHATQIDLNDDYELPKTIHGQFTKGHKSVTGVSDSEFSDFTSLLDLNSTSSERSHSNRNKSPARCPQCHKLFSKDFLEKYPEPVKGFKNELTQCKNHTRFDAEQECINKGYPAVNVDWANVLTRCERYIPQITDIIQGNCPSVYRQQLSDDKALSSGKRANMDTDFGSILPGYYGPRGSSIFLEWLTMHLGRMVRSQEAKDEQIRKGGEITFIQNVLVPELAVLLVAEDMSIGVNEALNIVKKTIKLGETLNDDDGTFSVANVIKSEPARKSGRYKGKGKSGV